ncbi:uncharacterized protein SAPINGB_P004936 [Magnusiomyces paraingens]|uniref:3-oxoacyl-[acyl-carrier-protein] synthase n=1 Tax=Magnusiomyces paraingens TaxID=2606893 RepID=A0A5E8BYY6_9ASCO|nr:uncharacterized protein SAPINGB_P004936 [Saprochaete ingens]VVT56292.1 unnamed protein product [Saprochaete ingens]
MSQLRRVVVTGLGVVSPLGVGVSHAWANLIAGKSGLVSLDSTVLANNPDVPCRVGGQVPLGSAADGKWDALEWVDKPSLRRVPTFAQYALAATKQALDDAQWHPASSENPLDQERTGVCVGSGIGGFEDAVTNITGFNAGGYRKIQPLFIPRLLTNMAAGHISINYKLKGPNHAVSTACTTGAHAIGDATNFISLGMADVMVAGSGEASLHPIALAGFSRAKSVATAFNDDPEAASRPFDKRRAGFIMGEGAGIFVLEELEHALARGAKIYAEVVGYGLSGDAHHITAPAESGDGARRSMQMAIGRSGVAPKAIGYVNAHATSTKLGDVAENNAICEVLMGLNNPAQASSPENFKSAASEINVSSSKASMGHLLGGAGSVEALFTVLALRDNVLPPTRNLDDPDEGFECNYIPHVAQTPKEPLQYAMTNSFGFGGTNASLLFKKWAN